jgi:large subunit ribosomal protein L23
MKPTQVIRRPLVTEKTTVAREGSPVVVFEVARDATKIDVKRAVEKLFGSKVEAVRTQIMHGKIKRQGRFAGPRPDWKKAWVRLKPGEKEPEFVEGS